MCAVSVDPPLLLVCVAKTSETLPLIERASSFVVTIMSPGGEDSVSRLATKSPGKFDRIGWTPSPISGHPIITAHRSAFLDCVVAERISAGDHDVFIARIVGGEHTPAAAPLIYLRRQFHRIVELDPEVTCANGPNSGRMK
jgi:flavin reductase (DIM6/NTAB) family NADH-FMN oxidoreductase RutF